MSQLKVPTTSDMDRNLEKWWESSKSYEFNTWTMYLKSLHGVNDAILVISEDYNTDSYTLITFENEEHKNWFILRWA